MSNPLRRYEGIEGLTPRDPIGAVLTVGTKGPKGNPTETDRFYFKVADSVKVGDQLTKPLHPGFAAFNSAEATHRQTIAGNLVHATEAEAFHYALSAQVLGPSWKAFPNAHPNRLPICSGDGTKATRLYGIGTDGKEDWREIDCPNERCEYRLGKVKPCKPSMRFLFRPRWKAGSPLPTPLTLLLSHSWNTAARFLGFFRHVTEQARHLGLSDFSLYGLPFVLTLAYKTKPSEASRFPVISISPDADLIAFFLAQREQLRQIGAGVPTGLLPAKLTDPEQNDPTTVAQDFAEIEPGTLAAKPSNGTEPPPLEATVIPEDEDPFPRYPTVEDESPYLSTEARKRIHDAAKVKGLTESQVEHLAGGRLIDAPSSAELEILRKIAAHKPHK